MRAAFLSVLSVGFLGLTAPAFAEEVKVGDAAPALKLVGTDGKTYELADFKGKKAVVVAWFPKADTSGCTAECKSMTEHGEDLKKLNIAYFTASVDNTTANKKFAEKIKVDYPILSDPKKSVATAYGVLGKRGYANRWTFYIDKEGVIRHIDKDVKVKTHGADVVAKCKELGFDK